MRSDRLEVSVTFDPARGHVASAAELRSPVTALSLGGLRRRIEALLLPDEVDVQLVLDRAARLERETLAGMPSARVTPSTPTPSVRCIEPFVRVVERSIA
jgi:hypothetical protein